MAGEETRSVREGAPPNKTDIEQLPDGPSCEGSGRDYGRRSNVSKTLKVRFSRCAGCVIVRYSAAVPTQRLNFPSLMIDRSAKSMPEWSVGE